MSLSLFGCRSKEEKKAAQMASEAFLEMMENSESMKAAEKEKKKAEPKQEEKEKTPQEKNEEKFEQDQQEVEDAEFYAEYTPSRKGTIKLKSFVVIEDIYNPKEKKLVLTVDYTNDGEMDDRFTTIWDKLLAYQDGVKLERSYSDFDKDQDTKIKPGTTLECVYTLALRNDTSDVEFETSDGTTYTLEIE